MNRNKKDPQSLRKGCAELQAAPPGDYSALFEMHIIAFFFARAALNHLPEGNDWIEC